MQHHKTKILYVITKSNFGGAQRYVYELATNLPRDDFEITVAFGGTGVLKRKLESAGVQTYSIPSFERDMHIWKEFKSLFELYKVIHRTQPDIVHLNSSKAGGSGALIARICGVTNIIFTAHGWPFHEKRNILWRILTWVLSWMTAILAHATILVSKYDRDHSWMPFVSRRFSVIHTALPRIDFLTREAARNILFLPEIQNRHRESTWLVSTAELTPNKNILTALAAVNAYNQSNPSQKIFYTLIGDGELLPQIRDYITMYNLEDDIHVAGYIPEARVYLKAFDIFLLPSLKEGLPYALLEAGAAEMPAIASNVGGIPEIIDTETTGTLIDPREKNTIVGALHCYVADSVLGKQHAGRLKAHVDTNFNLVMMLQKTIALYKK